MDASFHALKRGRMATKDSKSSPGAARRAARAGGARRTPVPSSDSLQQDPALRRYPRQQFDQEDQGGPHCAISTGCNHAVPAGRSTCILLSPVNLHFLPHWAAATCRASSVLLGDPSLVGGHLCCW
eukprot:2615500-Amphidinium_carterae.2